jgi:hypothetical protein
LKEAKDVERDRTRRNRRIVRLSPLFWGLERQVRGCLARRRGRRSARAIMRETRERFDSLLPEVGDIGGRRNRLTPMLLWSAWVLAFWEVMRGHGATTDEVGSIIIEAVPRQLAQYPRPLLRWLGRWRMGLTASRLQEASERSLERRYAADWVSRFVPGDGEEFAFGIDYVECGICKLYQQKGAFELVPWVCWLDYPVSDALGLGLKRTRTLGQGADHCDFRWTPGSGTQWGPPPESPGATATG